MTIDEAMLAVSVEYDDECDRIENDKAFAELMMAALTQEYIEIDVCLPSYVAQIGTVSGLARGTALPFWIYQLARMCFRLGMRVQRKIERPEEVTSSFWRSDKAPV